VDSSDNAFGSFLASRRAKVRPEQVGLPAGANRRVAGLRRTEVAALAGVSVEYLARLERGVAQGVSESVLDALSRALRLDDAEREHLIGLAHIANGGPARRRRKKDQGVRESVQLVLDSIGNAPAVLRNGRTDILATNALGRALYSELFAQPDRPANHARFIFFSPRAQLFYPDWGGAADDVVAILRSEAGRDPYDRGLTDLIGELSTRSDDFRRRWAAQDVRHHFSGVKHFHHPVVGELHLKYEAMDVSADEGLSLLIYPAAPGTPEADALQLLATWQATPDAVRALNGG
jgi:transcriptional regulator with XRE-family HTH domain